MTTLRFFLRAKNPARADASLWLRIRSGKQTDIKANTGIRIPVALWDGKRGCLKEKLPNSPETVRWTTETARKISAIRETVCIRIISEGEDIDTALVKSWIMEFSGSSGQLQSRSPSQESLLLPQWQEQITPDVYLYEIIEKMKSGELRFRGRLYASSSVRSWEKFRCLWLDFSRLGGSCGWKNFDRTLYLNFLRFCETRNYRQSSVQLYGSLFCAFANMASEEKLCLPLNVDQRCRTRKTADSFKAYLSPAEIESIRLLDLTDRKDLQAVRDIFLVGCYTGQRFSDYRRISLDQFDTIRIRDKSRDFIRIVQQKTGQYVCIPLLYPEIRNILHRYGGKLPCIAASTINRKIKEICRLAGIVQTVESSYCQGGRQIRSLKPKHLLISSHTARRSFITNAYLSGTLSLSQIMSISGHRSEQSLRLYLCQNREDELRSILFPRDTVTGDNCSVCSGAEHYRGRYCD